MADTTSTKKEDPRRIRLGSKEFPVRFSYLYAHEPKDDDDAKQDKNGKPILFYQTQVMIPKGDKAAKALIEKATREAAREKLGDKPFPPSWKTPLRDGDLEWEEKEQPELKGHWFLNCKSKAKPDVIGTKKDDDGKYLRLSKDEIKSGDYGRITLNFYYFENESKGIDRKSVV